MMHRKKGFTLIELLIVVAIIAILALIAVPNFLEAQTRAKVSRVKSDLRTLATAMESYYVDNNSYTNGQGGGEYPIQWRGFRLLTTPIAYITSIPMDGFGLTSINGDRRLATFEIGAGQVAGEPAGRNAQPYGDGMPSDTWEIESDGPDHIDDTGGSPIAGGGNLLPSTGSYPTDWISVPPSRMVNGFYDPTNGTMSFGNILRTQRDPTGRVFEPQY